MWNVSSYTPRSNPPPPASGRSVRPWALVVALPTGVRSLPRTRCASTSTPLAGAPRLVSSTWVVSCPIRDPEQSSGSKTTRPTLPRECQAEDAVRRRGIDVHAKFLTTLLDDIPGPIVRLEAELGDLRDVGEDA